MRFKPVGMLPNDWNSQRFVEKGVSPVDSICTCQLDECLPEHSQTVLFEMITHAVHQQSVLHKCTLNIAQFQFFVLIYIAINSTLQCL
jgi:hypothetical protein